jgi:hypothetical protein
MHEGVTVSWDEVGKIWHMVITLSITYNWEGLLCVGVQSLLEGMRSGKVLEESVSS